MAAAISMQPPHRPSMDRSSSFDTSGPSASTSSGRGGSTTRQYTAMYERPSSSLGRPNLTVHQSGSASGSHSQGHSRTSSHSSAAGPYGQPIPSPSFYSGGYGQAQHYHHAQQQQQQHGQQGWTSQLGGGNWASSAIPASAFYPAPFGTGIGGNMGAGGNGGQGQGPVFHQGFQQSQPDFAAWAGAYQQMMMASVQQQQHHFQQQQHQFAMPHPPPIAAEHNRDDAGGASRRRTSSGPSHASQGYPTITHRQSFDEGRSRPGALVHALPSGQRSASDSRYTQNTQQQIGGFHPYKRGPTKKTSREEIGSVTGSGSGSLPRSRSQPALASVAAPQGMVSVTKPVPAATAPASTGTSIVPQDEVARQRTLSDDSKVSSSSTLTPTKVDRDRSESPAPATGAAASRAARSVPPSAATPTTSSPSSVPAPKMSMPPRASTPLHPGPITNATNTPHPRPSPLSSSINPSTNTPEPAEKEKRSGLKGRLAKALQKDKAARAGSTPPSVVSSATNTPSRPSHAGQGTLHHASPSESSTRSGTPPITPPTHVQTLSSVPQGKQPPSLIAGAQQNSNANAYTSRTSHQPSEMQPMRPPHAPFAMPMHHQAMSSDVSLAETERTERTQTLAGEGGSGVKEKGKRSLFRMRNMSTDNISLSSTVSSASMMIRKMGSLGKLARRNSLMGISKIFKDKPKDEDGPLPEREGDQKESRKDKRERKKREKAAAAKGELAPAEVSRLSVEPDNDDRVISGLTPAAQLARQHTLRSKAEAEAKARAANRDLSPQDERDEADKMTGEPTWDGNTFNRTANASSPRSPTFGAPNVVHVQPRAQAMHVQHARAVAIPAGEYDSDDSSDGETMEDVTVRLDRNPLAGSNHGHGNGQRGSNRYSQTEESRDMEFRQTWGSAMIDRNAVPKKGILKRRSTPELSQEATRARSNSAADAPLGQITNTLTALSLSRDPNSLDGLSPPNIGDHDKEHLNFSFDSPAEMEVSSPTPTLFGSSPYSNPGANTSAPVLSLAHANGQRGNGAGIRSMTAPAQRRGIMWAPECAVYSTYDAGTYDRRSEPATCNNLTPELAQYIKQELNAFKLEMPVHPASKVHTHYFN